MENRQMYACTKTPITSYQSCSSRLRVVNLLISTHPCSIPHTNNACLRCAALCPVAVQAYSISDMLNTAMEQQQATAQLQDAVAWKIILEQLAQGQQTLDLDGENVDLSELICSLLQCSKGMTAMVHAACAGRVDCRMHLFDLGNDKQPAAYVGWQPAGQQHQLLDSEENPSPTQGIIRRSVSDVHDDSIAAACEPKHQAVGRWLAKHARLMRLFSMRAPCQMDPRIIEQSLTAGLDAAVGRSSQPAMDTVAARLATMTVVPANADAASAALAVPALSQQPHTAAASAQGKDTPSPAQPAQAVQSTEYSTGSSLAGNLLVQEVEYRPVSDGSILSCCEGCQHLTKLHISIGKLKDAQQSQQALASLTALRDLDIEADTGTARNKNAQEDLSDLAPAFQGLTQLTSLKWSGFKALTQDSLDFFPTTLPQLWYAGRGDYQHDSQLASSEVFSAEGRALNFGHVTGLTKLEMATVIQGDILPPALLELDIRYCDSLEPVSTLQHLRKFVLWEIPTAEQCKQLQAVTTLTDLRIGPGSFSSPEHATCGRELAKLPVVSARFRGPMPEQVISNMMAWVGLRELELSYVTTDATFEQLAQQLESLPGLTYLVLTQVQARKAPWVPDGESVTQAFLDSRAPGATALVRAVSRLQKLQFLSVDRVWLGPAVFDLKPGPLLKSVYLRGIGWHMVLYKEVMKQLQAQLEKAGVEDFRFG